MVSKETLFLGLFGGNVLFIFTHLQTTMVCLGYKLDLLTKLYLFCSLSHHYKLQKYGINYKKLISALLNVSKKCYTEIFDLVLQDVKLTTILG